MPLLFDWDEQQRIYRPIWICADHPEDIFVSSSYTLLGLDRQTAPGCMYQLPVCVHRSTLKNVRLHLNKQFSEANQSDYAHLGLEPTEDRDSEYVTYQRQYEKKRGQQLANGTSILLPPVPHGGVAPSAFDRTYMRMVNRDLGHAVCQFCVWGSYILLFEKERRLYSFHRQGTLRSYSECPQVRAGTHAAYLVPRPKMSPAYYQMADGVFMDGMCHSSRSDACIKAACMERGQWHDALAIRASGQPLPVSLLNQSLLYRWEVFPMFADVKHEARCKAVSIVRVQQLYEWIQTYDLSPEQQTEKHCPNTHRER